MAVFQLMFNAYSSLFMIYGWWFNEKKKQELEGFDDIKFGDLTFGGKLKSIIALFVPKFRLQM